MKAHVVTQGDEKAEHMAKSSAEVGECERHGDGANGGPKWGHDGGSWIGESSQTFLSFKVCNFLISGGWAFKQHVVPCVNPIL